MPKVVWWITGLHVCILLAYSILVPLYSSPDEPQHVDLAHLWSSELHYPAWDERDNSTEVLASLRLEHFNPGHSPELTADEAVPKDERPSLEQLHTRTGARSINQLSQHPPLYYVAAGTVERGVEVVTGDPSWDLEVWIYRCVSILAIAPLPLIIWHLARLLRLPTAVGVAATLVPLGIPQFSHISSAVNNDNLMLPFMWLTAPVALRIARGNLTRPTAVLAGVLTGLGLMVKGFAMILPLYVLAALVVAWRRGGRDAFRPAVVAGLTYGITAFVIGGWWWARNLIVYGNISPSRYDELVKPVDDVKVEWGTFLPEWASRTTRRFWGEFGWFDVAIPSWTVTLATVVVLVAIAAALVRRDRVANTVIGDRLLVAAPLLLLVITQFLFAFRGYLRTGQLPGMQGRYWFGALAGMGVIVALGLANLVRRRWVEWLPLATLAGVAAIQLVATKTILYFYWGTPGTSGRERIDAVVAWAPLPGEVIGLGALLAAVVGLAIAVQLVGIGRRAPSDEDPTADPGPAPVPAVSAPAEPVRTG